MRSGAADAAWPGVPLGRRTVMVPIDPQGELAGTREHASFHVAARWPDEPTPDSWGVHWTAMTVADACRRLPGDATLGIGVLNRVVSCAPQSLGRSPAAVDVGARDTSVSRLAAEHPFHAVARHQGAVGVYRLDDARGAATLLLATRSAATAHERSERDFADDCALAGVAEPAQLWNRENLPRRLRKQLDTLDQESV